MAADLVLHVGISKTGTTHVQNQVFDRHPGVINLGKPGFAGDADLIALNSALMAETFDLEAARAVVAAKVAPLLAGDRPLVWSEENLSFKPSQQARTAERLKALFPQARILITIREQKSFLQSMFFVEQNKAVARGGVIDASVDAWLDRQEGQPDSILKRLDYDALVRLYAGLFGDDRVHVLCFEQMAADRAGFVAALAGVLGVDAAPWLAAPKDARKPERTRISGRRAALVAASRVLPLKRLWALLPEALRSRLRRGIDAGAKAQAEPSARWQQRLAELSRPGNRALDRRHGLDLASRGYWI